MPRVLFIDDDNLVLESLERLLFKQRDQWDMLFEQSPVVAWERLRGEPIDAVVADMRMPELDGLELLARIKADPRTADVPVIFLTGEGDRRLKQEAFEQGAADFLAKPVDAAELRARLRSALRLKAAQDELRGQNERLAELVDERTTQLEQSRLDLIWRLAKAAEYRDEETGNHVVRVGCYAREIAATLGLPAADIETLYITAPLHDIGKIGIPDAILLKPGKLDPAEWEIMKSHCAIGARILREESKAMAAYLAWREEGPSAPRGMADPVIEMATEVVLAHHERWDGSGYPNGLAGQAIPLVGRIVAICDVFDALTSTRPYKRAFTEEKSVAILESGVGSHFDPEVYRAFRACFDSIRAVRAELSDSPVLA
jgi:putative two-component system response regulator